jgi:hypothetical protein
VKSERRFAGLRRIFTLPRTARSVEREVDEEIRFHLESRVAELIARGSSPAAARERALQSYGDVGASRHELANVDRRRLSRERWTNWLEAFRQDAGFALRVFSTQRGFAIASVLVFALGIGANATMFGVIDRLLLRPPAHIVDPASVMLIRYLRTNDGTVDAQDALSYAMYLDLVNTPGAFAGVAAYWDEALAVGPCHGKLLQHPRRASAARPILRRGRRRCAGAERGRRLVFLLAERARWRKQRTWADAADRRHQIHHHRRRASGVCRRRI